MSRLTSKGQVTIPAHIREHLALKSGDGIEFVVLDNGTVVVKPTYRDIMELDGFFAGVAEKPLKLSDLDAVIRDRAVKSL